MDKVGVEVSDAVEPNPWVYKLVKSSPPGATGGDELKHSGARRTTGLRQQDADILLSHHFFFPGETSFVSGRRGRDQRGRSCPIADLD